MKLDPDCVRAVLLTLEEHTSYQSILSIDENTLPTFPELSSYPLEKVLYHIQKCNETGFLNGVQYFVDSVNVGGLHFKGHEFLNNTRENKVWAGVKSVAAQVGTNSVQGLTKIASNVITSLIKAQFGLA